MPLRQLHQQNLTFKGVIKCMKSKPGLDHLDTLQQLVIVQCFVGDTRDRMASNFQVKY